MSNKNIFACLKQQKSLYLLFFCQILLLALALGSYLLNRGDAFSKTYTNEEHHLIAGEVAPDGSLSIDASHDFKGSFLKTSCSLDKGNYVISINYLTDSPENTFRASVHELSEMDYHTTQVTLDPEMQTASVTLDLSKDAEEVVFSAYYSGDGSLSVQQISIHETSSYYKRNIFYAFMLCILLTLCYAFTQLHLEKKKTALALTGIFLLSCYPLMTDYLQVGHDLPFHLLRIEGIYHGLLQGSFPVKVHPVWAKDYGYAVGVFYGDAALYLPAFLRLFGFSIQTAYKYFVAFMNLSTVLISYFCFKKMFSDKRIGLAASALYTFSLYRLADVYTRAALGESIALTFLPLVLYGFYCIFTEESPKLHWLKNAALVALGLTGLIQSHVLSCEMVGIFVVLACLILIKKVIKPYTFLALASGAGLTTLLNLGFLVPFLDFFDDSIYFNSPEWGTQTEFSIQNMGMFPTQLLGLFHRTQGGSWNAELGVTNEAAYSLGPVIVLCIALFLYLILGCRNTKEQDGHYKPALLCFFLGAFALYMSTCFFPWDALADTGAVAETLISNLQFPWRFLSLATVLLMVPSCYALKNLSKYLSANTTSVIFGALASVFVVSSGWYFYDFTFSQEPFRVYDTYELSSMYMYSYEYLPAGTNPEQLTAGFVLPGEGVSLTDYHKVGTNVTCTVETTKESYLEIPLNYYKYYQCRNIQTGERLSVEAGTNSMVKVLLPGNYSASLKISFVEPIHWRICEIVSLLSIIGVLMIFLNGKNKRRHT